MTNRDNTNDYRVQIVAAEHDRLEAYRIRYAVYVAEQRKSYPGADHRQQIFSDDLDQSATIILVKSESGSCGTVRANFLDSVGVRSAYENQIDLSLFSLIADRCISVCSRLAVLPEHRGRIVSSLLFSEIYRYGLSRNTELCFEACAPSLLPIFRRYGFREYMPPFSDPIVGQLHRMVLVLDDLSYLESVRSPFLGIAKQFGLAHQCRPWLERRRKESCRFTNQSSEEVGICN